MRNHLLAIVCSTLVLASSFAGAQTTAPATSSEEIRGSREFGGASDVGFNFPEPNHVIVMLGERVNFDGWLFCLDGVAGKTVRIDFKTRRKLNKWKTLNPVFAEATDLTDPATYKTGASNGTIKCTNGVSVPDTANQNWHFMTNTRLVSNNEFTVTQTFTSNSVWIANRVPYSVGFNERYTRGLKDNPYAKVIEVGYSNSGQPLRAVQIGNSDKPTVVIAGGEQAIQFDSMWCAQGAIEFLIGDTEAAKSLREKCCFIVIPMLDPDGVIRNQMIIPGAFSRGSQSSTSIAWANFFQNWVNAGHRLDVVFEMHNVQSLEAPHLSRAFIENTKTRGVLAEDINAAVVKQFQSAKLDYSSHTQFSGPTPDNRFGGWLTSNYGPILIIYEINAQAPIRHLDLPELQDTGRLFTIAAGEFLTSEAGQPLLKAVDEVRTKRRDKYFDNPATQPATNAIEAEALFKAHQDEGGGM